MLPVNVPVSLWGESARHEAEKEALFRHIFAETKGQVLFHIIAIPILMSGWGLMKYGRSIVSDLLMSQDTILLDYCDGTVIKKWLTAQLSDNESNFSKIIQLMSLKKH